MAPVKTPDEIRERLSNDLASGKTVVLFFYEASTRTRLSFDIAAKRLSADSIALSASGSSVRSATSTSH